MVDRKFSIGDKVILDCPESPEYNGHVCTIKGMEHRLDGFNFYCYCARKYVGLFNQDNLIPYEQHEKLVSSMDLSQLFKEGL